MIAQISHSLVGLLFLQDLFLRPDRRKKFLNRCDLVGLAAAFCHDRLITTESATEPVAAVVEVADGSSTPVGTTRVEAAFGTIDFGGRPAFFFTGAADEEFACAAAAFLATDFTGAAFFCATFFWVVFFLAATFVVDVFLLGVFLLLIFGMIATP